MTVFSSLPSSALAQDLPRPPQVGDLPGANQVPNVSSAPGAPAVPGVTNSGEGDIKDPTVGGRFGSPFAQPGPACPHETEGAEDPRAQKTRDDITCKPAGVSVVVLPNGNVLYWDGLEAEENVDYSVVTEIGDKAVNDQSRVMRIDFSNPFRSTWLSPNPVDAGANDSAGAQYLLPGAPPPLDQVFNDPGNAPGALFCSDQVLLSNGEVLVPGGTMYYEEPHVPGTPFGVSELQGLRSTRIFNPANNTWSATGNMQYGRWYPSLVTLPDGKVFVSSGVTKLLKPVYSQHPEMSGTNVEQTETYDPHTGRWTYNGKAADRSMPLFPRLHLLPDGKVYFDAGGQTFNPVGQSYDEAVWNLSAAYDPRKHSWQSLGVPAGVSTGGKPTSTSAIAGFRGSSFSLMLPLKPPYTRASFLAAGGVLGTSPGTYLATASSVIDSVDTKHGDQMSSTATGPLVNPRWYPTGVLLPTGQVVAFSGANRDEVVGPASGFPVEQAELFDPASGRWTPLATGHNPRTYHNTAVLLPTGQVLVGGNAPISTLYGYNQTLPGGFSNAFRDPSFEVYDPPYLHWGIPRPQIGAAPRSLRWGRSFTVSARSSGPIASVTLMRNTALTHLVDGDQRSVQLRVVRRSNGRLTLAAPPSGNVAPPGPYLLFVNERTSRGLIPSVAKQVFVGP
ncbi:MAG: galactose oxidase-like domain-containing protein [Gaiellaceae bacterium]